MEKKKKRKKGTYIMKKEKKPFGTDLIVH